MNAAENNLVRLFTGKSSLQATTLDEWEKLAAQYPYCSLIQVLFIQKIVMQQPNETAALPQHCAIYFQDAGWLQSKLYNAAKKHAALPIQPASYNKAVEEKNSSTPTAIAAGQQDAATTNIATLPAKDTSNAFLKINDVQDEPELPPLEEEETGTGNALVTEAAAKIAGVLQHHAADFKTPVSSEEAIPVSTEPYHTIDYFASQGIKADTQQPDDFTKKVHTFTDWLRQMKRLNQQPADLGSDPDMENFVQAIADTSNQPKAVDTEAMAAVWIKQGKRDKAIEVYEKLSLLSPAKTSYFAAKIQQLKKE